MSKRIIHSTNCWPKPKSPSLAGLPERKYEVEVMAYPRLYEVVARSEEEARALILLHVPSGVVIISVREVC